MSDSPLAQLGSNDRLVLGLLLSADQPLTAYDLLDRMRPQRAKVAPPTVYRALSRLVGLGLVRRIETLNAYIAARAGDPSGPVVFAICDDCGEVREHAADALVASLTAALADKGFHPRKPVVEVHGLCNSCDTDGAPA
jgi:Fur family zinc uptake transcriptional regulator